MWQPAAGKSRSVGKDGLKLAVNLAGRVVTAMD